MAKKSRNLAEFPVLGILYRAPLHGYDICCNLQEGIGSTWRLKKSQVYALLVRLEREGLVVHERVEQETLPAKKVFMLTVRGEDVFKKWLEETVVHIRDIRLEFPAKLWFSRQSDPACERRLVERQLAVCRENMGGLEHTKLSCRSQVESMCIDFRLAIIKGVISWLEGLLGPSGRTPQLCKDHVILGG